MKRLLIFLALLMIIIVGCSSKDTGSGRQITKPTSTTIAQAKNNAATNTDVTAPKATTTSMSATSSADPINGLEVLLSKRYSNYRIMYKTEYFDPTLMPDSENETYYYKGDLIRYEGISSDGLINTVWVLADFHVGCEESQYLPKSCVKMMWSEPITREIYLSSEYTPESQFFGENLKQCTGKNSPSRNVLGETSYCYTADCHLGPPSQAHIQWEDCITNDGIKMYSSWKTDEPPVTKVSTAIKLDRDVVTDEDLIPPEASTTTMPDFSDY